MAGRSAIRAPMEGGVGENLAAEAVAAKSKYRCTFCRLSRKKCTYNGIPATAGTLQVGECDTCLKATTKIADCSGPILYEDDHLFQYLTAVRPRKDRSSTIALTIQSPNQLQVGALQQVPQLSESSYQDTAESERSGTTATMDLGHENTEHSVALQHFSSNLPSVAYDLNKLYGVIPLPAVSSVDVPRRSEHIPDRVVQEMWSASSSENDTGQISQDFEGSAEVSLLPRRRGPIPFDPNLRGPSTVCIYDLLLEQVPERYLSLTKEIFSWCITSTRALTRMELIEVLLLKEDPCMSPLTDENTILELENRMREASGRLIVFDDNDHVRFIDESFTDYVLNGDSRFSIPLIKANEAVTLTIIQYLSNGDIKKDLNSIVPYRQAISRYMVQCLPFHYKAAESGPTSCVPGFLLAFMNERHSAFLNWCVAYDDISDQNDVINFIMRWKPSLGLILAQVGLRAFANMLLEIGKHPDCDHERVSRSSQESRESLMMDHSFGQLSEQDFLLDSLVQEASTVE